jgi:hypothetical protein
MRKIGDADQIARAVEPDQVVDPREGCNVRDREAVAQVYKFKA